MKTGVRYDVRYRVNGRQREKSFKRKVDAVKFRATVEADLARGDWIDDRKSKQTVGEFAERWFATIGGHRASTQSRYRAILDRHVLPEFGDAITTTYLSAAPQSAPYRQCDPAWHERGSR